MYSTTQCHYEFAGLCQIKKKKTRAGIQPPPTPPSNHFADGYNKRSFMFYTVITRFGLESCVYRRSVPAWCILILYLYLYALSYTVVTAYTVIVFPSNYLFYIFFHFCRGGWIISRQKRAGCRKHRRNDMALITRTFTFLFFTQCRPRTHDDLLTV